jgi:isopentenyl-diphosphate delta-isomerase
MYNLSMEKEEVVLVDEGNNVLGTMPKTDVHREETPLHRAFSVFIFNPDKKLLLQQRSAKKKTWPLMWSNSCCGHPKLGENNIKAAKRRIKDELGMEVDHIEEVAPYRYKFSKDNVMENEICPILVAFAKEEPKINKDEVESAEWIEWPVFLNEIKNNPKKYSPWCVEEAFILNKSDKFNNLMDNY